jgi:hypothetical protein
VVNDGSVNNSDMVMNGELERFSGNEMLHHFILILEQFKIITARENDYIRLISQTCYGHDDPDRLVPLLLV